MKGNLKVIISGGGTGGHIFPAVSIANAIKEQHPDAEILFVGAEGRMEMQRVPAAGYKIIGLPVAGFDRKHLLKNFSVIIKSVEGEKNHQGIQAGCGSGCRWLCQRTDAEDGWNDGSAYIASRTELVRWGYQQASG